MSSLREQKIQLYLLRVTAYLFGMPRREKEEIRQEVRQHLEALISTHEYEDESEEEAVEAALHQFGDPRKIGAEMARSWRKKQQNRIASERKAKEAVKPIGQRRRERAVSWLGNLVFGIGCYALISSEPTVGTWVWNRLIIIAIVWGLVAGLVNAIQPVDVGQELGQAWFREREEEAKERGRDLSQLPPFPRSATMRQRLSRCFLVGMSNWARRYRQRLLREAAQPVPRLDWRQIMTSVFWTGVVLLLVAMLPFDPSMKRIYVAIGLTWKVESVSQLFWRRLIVQRRISQR